MKFKTLAITAAIGLAATVTYGQGILIWNIGNSGGPTATSGGLVYTNNFEGTALGIFDGITRNVGIEVFGGPSATQLTSMGTFTPLTDSKGFTGFDLGKFQAGTAINVPGVAAGGSATIQLNMWYETAAGNAFANYAAALAGGGSVDTATFLNPVSNPGGNPPSPDQQLTGMPSMELRPIPEPSTILLAGLGVGALWLLRRRN